MTMDKYVTVGVASKLETEFSIYEVAKNTASDPKWLRPHVKEIELAGSLHLNQLYGVIKEIKATDYSIYQKEIAESMISEKLLKARQAGASILKSIMDRNRQSLVAMQNKILRQTEVPKLKDPILANDRTHRFIEIRALLRQTDPAKRQTAVENNLEYIQSCSDSPDEIVSKDWLIETRKKFAFNADPKLVNEEKDSVEIFGFIKHYVGLTNQIAVKMFVQNKLPDPLPRAEFFEIFPPVNTHLKGYADSAILEEGRAKDKIQGVWIPAEVAFNPELSYMDHYVFWLINLLDCWEEKAYCTATNKELGNILGVGAQTVSNSISKLKSLAYLTPREVKNKKNNFSSKRYIFINKKFKKIHRNFAEKINYILWRNIDKRPIKNFIGYYYTKVNNIISSSLKKTKEEDIRLRSNLQLPFQSIFDNYSVEARELFEFWDTFGSPLKRNIVSQDNKSFIRAMMLLEKRLRKYTKEEIARAMVLYYEMISSDEYILSKNVPGHIVGLGEFFEFNKFTKEKILGRNIVAGIRDWFLECHSKDKDALLEKYGKFIKNEFPEFSAKFKQLWISGDYEFGGNEKSLSIRDKNNFRKAAIAFSCFLEKTKPKIKFLDIEQEKERLIIKYVFEAIKMDFLEGDKIVITSGWLCSRYTYDIRLPKYFRENDMMNK